MSEQTPPKSEMEQWGEIGRTMLDRCDEERRLLSDPRHDHLLVIHEVLKFGYFDATNRHPDGLQDPHKAYGVVTEEYKEFEKEVFRRERDRDPVLMLKEAMHLMVTSARTIIDQDLAQYLPDLVRRAQGKEGEESA